MKKVLIILGLILCFVSFAQAQGTEFCVQMGPTVLGFIPAQAAFHLGLPLGRLVPLAGLDFYSGTFKLTIETDEDTYDSEYKGHVIMPKIGVKFNLAEIKKAEVVPYLLASVKHPFINVEAKYDGETDEFVEDINNEIQDADLFIFEFAYGRRYFVSEKFAVGAEAGVNLNIASYNPEKEDGVKVTGLGNLISTYAGINLTYIGN